MFRSISVIISLLFSLSSFAQNSVEGFDLTMFDSFNISPIQVNGELSPENSQQVKLSDLYSGRWVIVDLSATWCPYCKLDQYFFASHKNELSEHSTTTKLWESDVVQVHLIIEYQKEGGFQQTQDIARSFLSTQALSRDTTLQGLNRTYIDTLFVNTDDPKSFTRALDKNGRALFEGFSGFPYQLVFNPKGELVFRGQFTEANEGEDWSEPYKRHYQMLTNLICNNYLK